jgi:hypothetical protein
VNVYGPDRSPEVPPRLVPAERGMP